MTQLRRQILMIQLHHHLVMINFDFRLYKSIGMRRIRKVKIIAKIMNFKFIYILIDFESLNESNFRIILVQLTKRYNFDDSFQYFKFSVRCCFKNVQFRRMSNFDLMCNYRTRQTKNINHHFLAQISRKYIRNSEKFD